MHALADNGECDVLATVCSTRNPWSPGCVQAVNAFYGRPDLPLGRPKTGPQKATKYAENITQRSLKNYDVETVPEVLEVYRRILTEQPDDSVTIVTVGYLTNVAGLLKLPAVGDKPSGKDLITRKVKAWVCMGGNFIGRPAVDDMKLSNNNFSYDKDAALYAVAHWPKPLIFVGREIGSVPSGLTVGKNLKTLPEENPIRFGYALWFGGEPKSRHVADQTTVLYAVRGPGEYWKLESGGRMDLKPDMTFRWVEDAGSQQSYVLKRDPTKKADDRAVEKLIDDLMLQTPKTK
ncbi:MAG: hypothetical protein QM811_22030 [Pirellulales bacterium]